MRSFFLVCILACSIFIASGNAYLNSSKEAPPVKSFPDSVLVSVNPSTIIKQGQTIFVEVASKSTLKNPYIIFKGKKFRMFSLNKNIYRGLIGIDAVENPGKREIIIIDDTGKLNQKKYVDIVSAKYPIQNIVVTGKKGGLQATRDELVKVQRAKYAQSDNSYWIHPPFNSPSKGCIISDYGLTRYHNGVPTGDFHKGVDIKAPQGQRIDTIASGKILIAEMFRLHGGTVAVDHGQGVVSIYLHMSKITAKKGELVNAGQKIGEIGATGYATGPHLHWGLYVNGIPVDPMNFWIKKVNKCS